MGKQRVKAKTYALDGVETLSRFPVSAPAKVMTAARRSGLSSAPPGAAAMAAEEDRKAEAPVSAAMRAYGKAFLFPSNPAARRGGPQSCCQNGESVKEGRTIFIAVLVLFIMGGTA